MAVDSQDLRACLLAQLSPVHCRRVRRGELSGTRVVLKAYPSGRLPEADAMAANEVMTQIRTDLFRPGPSDQYATVFALGLGFHL